MIREWNITEIIPGTYPAKLESIFVEWACVPVAFEKIVHENSLPTNGNDLHWNTFI